MNSFKCEESFQCVAIGDDEWYYPDIFVTIALERGDNKTDQEAEWRGSGMGFSIWSYSGPRGRFHITHPAR
jgi:hypothetical protein